MCVCVFVCIYIYIYIYVCVCVCVCLCTRARSHVSGPRGSVGIVTRARVERLASRGLILDRGQGVLFARPALGLAQSLVHCVLEGPSVASRS
jgi:hypothetical protein